MHANADPPADYLNSFFFSALAKKGFASGGVASLSGALWVHDGNVGSTVMLAGLGRFR